ncbi:MAG: helicase-related protein [Acidimicrobiales bacterium]
MADRNPGERLRVDLVERVILAPSQTRLVVSAPPGVGKVSAGAAAIAEVLRKSPDGRVVVVIAHRTLSAQWQAVLQDLGLRSTVVDGPEYREMELDVPPGESPWSTSTLVVTSVDFIKRPGRLDELLQVAWDLVVFDDVFSWPGLRREVLERLWVADSVRVLVAMTVPTAGVSWPKNPPPSMLKYQVDAWPGLEFVDVEFSPDEQAVADRVAAFEADTSHVDGWERVAGQLLGRVAASSLPMITSQRPEEAFQGSLDDRPGRRELSDSAVAHELDEIADLASDLESDAKMEALLALVADRTEAAGGPVVVFSGFARTAGYLAAAIRDRFDVEPIVLTGSTPSHNVDDPSRTAASGTIVVATDAGVQGIEFPSIAEIVHYDPPASEAAFSVRNTRRRESTAESGRLRSSWVIRDPVSRDLWKSIAGRRVETSDIPADP